MPQTNRLVTAELEVTDEPLHPDLQDYVYEDEDESGPRLFHSLVIQAPLWAPNLANRQYELGLRNNAKCLDEDDWFGYVFGHTRPFRLDALTFIRNRMPVAEWWLLAKSVWTDSENIFQTAEEWLDIFEHEDASTMMSAEERTRLNALPETVTIYRGAVRGLNEAGLSYSLSRDRAAWFARRGASRGQPVVIKIAVARILVVALFETRNEDELIVLPDDVTVVERSDL